MIETSIIFWNLRIVPPRIMKDVSPTSVKCERYTVCCLCCYATSDSPVSYLWTKNGQDPINDDIKVMNNNSIFITPGSAQDYGVYMCNASNSFGSTSYEITLIEDRKSLTKATTMEDDSECILFVCLFVHLLVCISIPLNKYLGYLGHWLLVHGECNREDRRKRRRATSVISDEVGYGREKEST